MEEIKSADERIIESFSSGRCPLCAMLRQDEFDSLCHWVGESAEQYKGSQDRKKLIASGGFCNYHFWEFQRLSTHYGSAGIGLELIDRLAKILRACDRRRLVDIFRKRNEDFKILSLEGEGADCLLCRDLKKNEQAYLKELTGVLKDSGYQTRYAKGCGLCLPHFIKIIDYVEDDTLLEFLFKAEISQLEKIKSDAMNFIKKRQPPLCWGQTEDEKKSGLKAIEKLVGRSGA